MRDPLKRYRGRAWTANARMGTAKSTVFWSPHVERWLVRLVLWPNHDDLVHGRGGCRDRAARALN